MLLDRGLPPNVVEVKKDGWTKHRGYVILSDETGLVIHYLSEFERHRNDENDDRPRRPVRTYEQFVRKAYYYNQGAVSRILAAANEEPLRELDRLSTEFNSLLACGTPSAEDIEKYIAAVEAILRK